VLVAMMIVVAAITAVGLYIAQHNLASEVEREMQSRFQGELAALHNAQEVRHAALAERCRALARKPRIHAALEDNALDLLYPSAEDELRDMMAEAGPAAESPARTLHAEFYRFLDAKGDVIPPPADAEVGELRANEELSLALNGGPRDLQNGYLVKQTGAGGETVVEIIAVPIISTETAETIAALVLGFKPALPARPLEAHGMQSGIWVGGRLQLPAYPAAVQAVLGGEVSRAIASSDREENRLTVRIGAAACSLFYKRLNPASHYPPAYEVCLFPLADLAARQQQLRWQILGAGTLMLLIGFAASNFFSVRLSLPVEKLAVDSEVNRSERERAETALEYTSVELRRSARFSADASHQLKTPVTVLRAGLEELLARENLSPEAREELAQLVHQTFRLSSVIEDLLLLSRMDAGRLQLEFAPLDLSWLMEAELDDLGAQPDTPDISIEPDFPAALQIAGEKRYTTMIVRNLLENAWKYNRPGGRIRVKAWEEGDWVVLSIGNSGRTISAAAQEHIFERFHRGPAGEDVPGHGLGLNLARELARLHGGDLRLVSSRDGWTEFEARFRPAKSAVAGATHSA
jgi:signal transduction histidine kinase